MEPMAAVETLEAFSGRGAGTDPERRAALRLAAQLSESGRQALIETFWCRPNWALTHAWHAALAVAGSLVSIASPVAGIAILGIALISTIADALAGISLGRRLTPERASQNVVAPPKAEHATARLVLTANYDSGRAGLAYRDVIRRPASALKVAVKGFTPGWIGWMVIAILWLLATSILRLDGHKSEVVGALELAPTVGFVVGFALLLDLAMADWSPGAGDNASGVAAVLAAAEALADSSPAHLDVEVVLTGAGQSQQIGLSRYVRRRRHQRKPGNTIVIGVAACGAGTPRWWSSDGALLPLHYARSLRHVADRVASDEAHLNARPCRGRGSAPGLPARYAGLPAITLGCLDRHDLASRSHQRSDVAPAIDPAAVEATVQFVLLVVDGVDAALGRRQSPRGSATPA
jgi:hypothetical protein